MKKSVSILLFLTLFAVGTARADPIRYGAMLEGAAENPPNSSGALGFAVVEYDPALQTLEVLTAFSGLTTPVSAAHIHCCVDPPGTAGVATPVPFFPGFPTGVTFGFYNEVFDLTLPSSFNPAFVTANGGTAAGAEAALAAGLAAGQAYFNIHTSRFPGGEIRGFLTASTTEPVPEPATMLLMGSGIGLLAAARRRKRRNGSD